MESISLWHAFFLGIVEGVTEFIPVSSTGHLILTSYWMGLSGEKVKTFEVFIQLGAILAVMLLYCQRFTGLLRISREQLSDITSTRSFIGFHGMFRIGLAIGPIFVMGALFGQQVKDLLFNPSSVAAALIVGGVCMLVLERFRPQPMVLSLEEISLPKAAFIGLVQCLALWPGISRSGSTIVGAMIAGLDRKVAAEFSFLIAVPVMCVATVSDLLQNLDVVGVADIPAFAVGFVVSFITALLAVRTFIAALSRITLVPFGLYRIVLGMVVFLVVSR